MCFGKDQAMLTSDSVVVAVVSVPMSQDNVYLFNWNVRGLNSKAKQDAVKVILQQYGASIVCLQETKIASMNDRFIF